MNADDAGRQQVLEARLRRMLSGLDARAGFEERLQSRIVAGGTPVIDRRAEFEARRIAARRRLRRDAWSDGITIAAIGVGICALALRFAPEIGRITSSAIVPMDPLVVGGATLAALALGLWPYLRTIPGLRLG